MRYTSFTYGKHHFSAYSPQVKQ